MTEFKLNAHIIDLADQHIKRNMCNCWPQNKTSVVHKYTLLLPITKVHFHCSLKQSFTKALPKQKHIVSVQNINEVFEQTVGFVLESLYKSTYHQVRYRIMSSKVNSTNSG